MKKGFVVALSLLFAMSAFASDSLAPASTAATTISAAPSLTLGAALDKVGREYKEMWIKDKSGKRVRRVCDQFCTIDCDNARTECVQRTGDTPWCEQQWELCMCENGCCTGPRGNPYCP